MAGGSSCTRTGSRTKGYYLKPSRIQSAWCVRGSCGKDVSIERRGGDAETVRNLRDPDIRIGESRLGRLDVVIGEFCRTSFGTAKSPRGGKTCLSALTDQTMLDFHERAAYMKHQLVLVVVMSGDSVRPRKLIPRSRALSIDRSAE